MNWRGTPLTSHQVVVNLIGAVTTTTGLRVHAELDEREYPTGIRISDAEMDALPIHRHDWHGEWNYTMHPDYFWVAGPGGGGPRKPPPRRTRGRRQWQWVHGRRITGRSGDSPWSPVMRPQRRGWDGLASPARRGSRSTERYNTGDAQAMGYHAGAALANMESVEATLTPKGFSCQGLNALVSLGAYFVNKSGERFMFKYDKKGENARRAVIADAVINEYLLGNGPIYLDCRHLPLDMLDHMEHTLQVDRYTLPAYYEQKGVNFREELVEVSISELSIRRSGVYFRGSGLAVDTNGETSVEALFAAGDCATVSGGISGCGRARAHRGRRRRQRIKRRIGALPRIDAQRDRSDSRAVRRPSGSAGGMPWKQFEHETQQTVTDYVGVRRTEKA